MTDNFGRKCLKIENFECCILIQISQKIIKRKEKDDITQRQYHPQWKPEKRFGVRKGAKLAATGRTLCPLVATPPPQVDDVFRNQVGCDGHVLKVTVLKIVPCIRIFILMFLSQNSSCTQVFHTIIQQNNYVCTRCNNLYHILCTVEWLFFDT